MGRRKLENGEWYQKKGRAWRQIPYLCRGERGAKERGKEGEVQVKLGEKWRE